MNELEDMSDAEVVKAFRQMTDEALHQSAVRTAESERRITLSLLRHLTEIERRHLYSKFSVSSLHGYCVQELKMDEGTAGRRVSAARLLRDLPAIEEKILSGVVTLTSVAQAGIFFRKESKYGNAFTMIEKRELISELENKSTREVDRILISKSDHPEIHFRETLTPRTEAITEVKLHFDEETMAAINRLKEIWSHALPHGNFADIVKRSALEAVAKHDPLMKKTSAQKSTGAITPAEQKSKWTGWVSKRDLANEEASNGATLKREISTAESARVDSSNAEMSNAEAKRRIWDRDEGRCTFIDTRTGERCGAKHFIEEDHIQPKARGGEYNLENIRLRCRAHNHRHAINCFGQKKMREHLKSMQQ